MATTLCIRTLTSYRLAYLDSRCLKMLVSLLNQVDFPSVCCLKSFEGSLVWIPFINRHPCPSPPAHFFAHTPWELAIYVSLRAQIIHDYLWLQWWDVNRNWGPSIILEVVISWFLATRWRKAKTILVFRAGVFANNFYVILATSWCQPVLWTCCAIYSHVPSEEAVFSKWSNNVLMVWIGVEEIIFTAEVAKNKTKNTKEICHNAQVTSRISASCSRTQGLLLNISTPSAGISLKIELMAMKYSLSMSTWRPSTSRPCAAPTIPRWISVRDSRIANHVFHLKILEIYWGRQELIAYKQLCILLKGGALESNVMAMPVHLGPRKAAWGLWQKSGPPTDPKMLHEMFQESNLVLKQKVACNS